MSKKDSLTIVPFLNEQAKPRQLNKPYSRKTLLRAIDRVLHNDQEK